MTMTHQGASAEAIAIAEAQRASRLHLGKSETFSKDRAYEELNDVWRDCRSPSWNGCNASPVDQQTYQNAWRFLEALPLGYPLPSAGVEADGHLTLEWHRDSLWTLSVSISPEGTLHYAALFDNEDPRGSSLFFGEIPETILFLIRRVFPQ